MSLVLDTTLGATTANSYATLQYANEYWAQHYSTTKAAQWAALSDPQKTAVLIQACAVIETARFTSVVRLLDAYRHLYDRRTRTVLQVSLVLPPVKFYYYQRLQFPRNIDRDVVSGALFIPEQVLMAQCEQAVYYLNFDESVMASRLQGVTADTTHVGPIHISQQYTQNGSAYSPMAMEFLRPFMIKTGNQIRRA